MHAEAHLYYYAADGIKGFLVSVCKLGEFENDSTLPIFQPYFPSLFPSSVLSINSLLPPPSMSV